MKSSLFSFLILIFSFNLFSQNSGDFKTHQSGSWSDVNSWEKYDGVVWVYPAPAFPSATDDVITILNGHIITVDVNVAIDQVTVNATAELNVNTGVTLTIADGTDTTDLNVYGTLGQTGTITSTGRIFLGNGGTYIYYAGTLPNITWGTGSTCRIEGGSSPANLNLQSLYNLTVNLTTLGANGGPNFPNNYELRGDLTVLSSKSLQFRLANISGGETRNIYIRGNINVGGSTALLTSTGSGADTAAKIIVNVDGNVNLSAGQWSLNNSGSAYAEWKIKGDINITGGTLQSGTSGEAIRRTINFCSGSTQQFSLSLGSIGSAKTTFKVSNNSIVQMNFPFNLMAGGTLFMESGKFLTSSANTITIPANGNVISGGSYTGFVNGPLAWTIATASTVARTFPVGNGSANRPVVLTLSQNDATSTKYTVEVVSGAPTSQILPGTLDSVSSIRYYKITKGTGSLLSPTLGATAQFTYDIDDNVPDATLVRTAKSDGSGTWLNLGGSGTANNTGTITTNTFFEFSDFVLGYAAAGSLVSVPTVNTTSVTYISATFASSGGNVIADGGGAVTDRGVCWSTSANPTVSNSHTSDGSGNGIFTSTVTPLLPGTTYFLRAYATNSAGTGYGDEVSFATLAAVVAPTVTTTSISNILVTTATSGGNVTEWGGATVIAKGICWNTTGSPTISDNFTNDGNGLGSFISGLSPLTGATTYYVRAYATNSAGTGYGSELFFTTQTPQADTTVVVAKDGSGNYLTVQEAFRNVPLNYTGKWRIYVKKGTYYEKDTLTAGKINVVLEGEDRDSTIITYDDYADRYGSGNPGTSGSFTIAIDASDFIAKNITFRNTYAPQIGVTGTQAVALRTQGDRHQYYNCKILGYQDTYYTYGGNGTGRMYHKNCFIEGTVDFIFGRNIVVFDSCTIHEIRNTATMTAASTDPSSKFGYVFRNCTIVADSIGYDGNAITSFFLGRPWQGSPRTVFLSCYEPSNLNAAAWQSWNVTPALYAEYACSGPGSSISGRVGWSSQLTDSAAQTYSLANIFAKTSATSNLILYNWVPQDTINFNIPLPVELVSFSASTKNNTVELKWTTSSERDNTGWYVEKNSSNGWENLDFIKGNGNSNKVNNYSFTDNNIKANTELKYRLKQIDVNGQFSYSKEISINVPLPNSFNLLQNYPNPFNPATVIKFQIPSVGFVTLRIYDLLGKEIATLVNEKKAPGSYSISFNGSNLSSGVYFYRLTSEKNTLIKKMLLLK